MTIKIVQTGITLLQDAGRFGFSEIGVPRSGAFDSYRYQLCCALVAGENIPAFEIFSGTFEITTDQDLVLAIVGPAQVLVDGKMSFSGQTLSVGNGQKLSVTPTGNGPAYLVITGLQVDMVLNSASNDSLSGLGPKHVRVGTEFNVITNIEDQRNVGSFIDAKTEADNFTFRYIPGPHEIAVSGVWKVFSTTRIGIRLESDNPTEPGSANLASFPVMPGCIQVPPSGQPVILGPDCGTTGGYRVAGVVIAADLHLLARLKPGMDLELRSVTIDEAKLAQARLSQQLAKAIIRPSGFGSW